MDRRKKYLASPKGKAFLERYRARQRATYAIRHPKETRTCPICQKQFDAKRTNHLFCSDECYVKDHGRRNNEANTAQRKLRLTTSTIGAVSELQVSADLLSKGYDVFRSVSPTSSCDLAILQDGKLLRVEVRTGYFYMTNSGIRRVSRFYSHDEGRSDILATAYADGVITYKPDLS